MNFYLADDSQRSFTFFSQLIEEEPGWTLVGSAKTFEEFLSDIFRFEPDIILTSIAFLALLDSSQHEQLIGTLPSSIIIAISDRESLDELRAALKLGAKDLLVAGKSKEHIRETIERNICQEKSRRDYLVKQDHFSDPLPDREESQIIALCSGKGGVGKSFISSHLAAILAKLSQAKIVLVDLNIQFADLTTLLNIPDADKLPDLTHLIPIIDEIDANHLESVLWTHPEGFKVLLSPRGSKSAEQLTEEHLEKILHSLSQEFDLIILDVPTSLNRLSLKAIARATSAFIVVTPDIPATQNGLLLLHHLEEIGLPKDKFKLILNEMNRKSQLSSEELEKVFSLPVAAEIHQDHEAVSYFENKGKLLTSHLDLGIMEGVLILASQLYPFEMPEKSRLARLWHRFRQI